MNVCVYEGMHVHRHICMDSNYMQYIHNLKVYILDIHTYISVPYLEACLGEQLAVDGIPQHQLLVVAHRGTQPPRSRHIHRQTTHRPCHTYIHT